VIKKIGFRLLKMVFLNGSKHPWFRECFYDFQNCLYPADTAPELDSLRIDFGSLL
jgi:hypothetical protein